MNDASMRKAVRAMSRKLLVSSPVPSDATMEELRAFADLKMREVMGRPAYRSRSLRMVPTEPSELPRYTVQSLNKHQLPDSIGSWDVSVTRDGLDKEHDLLRIWLEL